MIIRDQGEIIHFFKSGSGLRELILVSSNAYQDLENEFVTEASIAEFVKNYSGGNHLLFWHGGAPIGEIVHVEKAGPFLIEVARELPNASVDLALPEDPSMILPVRGVWDHIQKTLLDWKVSIGFKVLPGDKTKGEINVLRKMESSVLRVNFEANPYTLSAM